MGVVGARGDPLTYAIIGAAMEVHKELGCGFLEPVYQAALRLEFDARRITYRVEVPIPVRYKGSVLSVRYRADFLCFDEILVETKAIERLTSREESQLINYLAASQLSKGLLLNFGSSHLQFKRFVGPAGQSSVQSVSSVGHYQ
jgi:GxxExxY protein